MVAVSGGVDSVVLLHLLAQTLDSSIVESSDSAYKTIPPSHHSTIQLLVAHFDHGIRPDSGQDRKFVARLAAAYGLPFETVEGKLGSRASEATARQARYAFLRTVARRHQARAIVTAHHQDDLIETAIINMLRGTGRKGLSALNERDDIKRPLLPATKQEILEYARAHQLTWSEDSTNQNEVYLRNYVRKHITANLDPAARKRLLTAIMAQGKVNPELDTLLVKQITNHGDKRLKRQWFAGLPHEVAREVMAGWLRRQSVRDFSRQTIERLVVAGKTAKAGSRHDILKGVQLQVGADELALSHTER